MQETFFDIFPALLIVGAPVILIVGILLLCGFVKFLWAVVTNLFKDKPKPKDVRQREFLDQLQEFSE